MIALPDDLRQFLPDERWFGHRPRGIHGTPHTTRVLVWSAVLIESIGRRDSLLREELLWAAAVHDVGRVNDGIDRGHGLRSAEWVAERLAIERPAAAKLDLEFVAELCQWHEVRDAWIERWSIELAILKDADALDRARLGDLDPKRLRFQHSLALVDVARELEPLTNRYDDLTAEDVLNAAKRQLG